MHQHTRFLRAVAIQLGLLLHCGFRTTTEALAMPQNAAIRRHKTWTLHTSRSFEPRADYNKVTRIPVHPRPSLCFGHAYESVTKASKLQHYARTRHGLSCSMNLPTSKRNLSPRTFTMPHRNYCGFCWMRRLQPRQRCWQGTECDSACSGLLAHSESCPVH